MGTGSKGGKAGAPGSGSKGAAEAQSKRDAPQTRAEDRPQSQSRQQGQDAPAAIRKGIYLTALIYVEGNQAPADNFNAFAKAALRDRLAFRHDPAQDALKMTLKQVEEKTDVAEGEEDEDDKGSGGKEKKFEF